MNITELKLAVAKRRMLKLQEEQKQADKVVKAPKKRKHLVVEPEEVVEQPKADSVDINDEDIVDITVE